MKFEQYLQYSSMSLVDQLCNQEEKSMKKFFTMMLCSMLLLTGCSSQNKELSYKAGTYEGISENGMGGSLKVEVEFKEDAISSVKVIEHKETPNISDGAILQIPSDIVKYQSLKLDAVSGATITSNAILEAVCMAANEAGNACETLKNKEVDKTLSKEVIEITTDLVIIGGGASGMSAATSAAYEGMESIVVFEKQSNVGGNAIVSGGFVPNTNLPTELKADNNAGYDAFVDEVVKNGPQTEEEKAYWDQLLSEVEAWKQAGKTSLFDSPLWMAIESTRADGGSIEDYLFYVDNLNSFNGWMEEFGVEWNKAHGIVGYSWPRWTSVKGYFSGEGFFHYFDEVINKNKYPIDIYTNTPVTKINTNEQGEVIGVTAVSTDGTTYNVIAKKGVLLATGGYSANKDMLVEYNTMWDGLTKDIITTNTAGSTGDGILLAEELGAQTALMDQQMMFPMADIKTGSTEAIVGTSASSLMVNKEGVRFTNETGTRWDISADMFKQTDHLGYIISDSMNSLIADGKTQGGVDVEKMLQNGELYQADTLEELATLIQMDPTVLVNTVNEYNTMVETHEDAAFGRTTFEPNSEVKAGPFYAYPCTPGSHITIGGVVINYDTLQVVNKDGKDIPNLFAVGEVVAGECGIDGAFAAGKATGAFITHNVESRDLK